MNTSESPITPTMNQEDIKILETLGIKSNNETYNKYGFKRRLTEQDFTKKIYDEDEIKDADGKIKTVNDISTQVLYEIVCECFDAYYSPITEGTYARIHHDNRFIYAMMKCGLNKQLAKSIEQKVLKIVRRYNRKTYEIRPKAIELINIEDSKKWKI